MNCLKCTKEMQTGYSIRTIKESDYKRVAEIYNSNHKFLLTHLGMELVDDNFICNEMLTMKDFGFLCCGIVGKDSQMLQGVLDYKFDEEVYLSLLMIDSKLQMKGVGSSIYSMFERDMIKKGGKSIRIDVVNDYQGNLVPFWKKFGFFEDGKTELVWGNKKSTALIMRKELK